MMPYAAHCRHLLLMISNEVWGWWRGLHHAGLLFALGVGLCYSNTSSSLTPSFDLFYSFSFIVLVINIDHVIIINNY